LRAAGADPRNPIFGERGFHNFRTQDASLPKTAISMTRDEVTRLITWPEIKARDPAKPWFVVKGNVYDGTAFLKEHPGGPDSILLAASDDATEDFMAIHSPEGQAKLAEVRVS
jgi:nitrate reductase (NAD(P)H)